jgi:hypothetical protein
VHAAAARPDGFIPHIVLWQQQHQRAAGAEFKITMAHPYFTATTQPPVIARAIVGRLLRLDAFNWEDVMFNSIYADGLQSLARLCRVAQRSEAKAAEFELRSARVAEALISKCWDQESGAFWDLNGLDERPQETLMSS